MAERDSRTIIEGLRERVLALADKAGVYLSLNLNLPMDTDEARRHLDAARSVIDFIAALEAMERNRPWNPPACPPTVGSYAATTPTAEANRDAIAAALDDARAPLLERLSAANIRAELAEAALRNLPMEGASDAARQTLANAYARAAAAESARRDMQQRHDRAVDVVRGIVASIKGGRCAGPDDAVVGWLVSLNAIDAARQWLRELDDATDAPAAPEPPPVNVMSSDPTVARMRIEIDRLQRRVDWWRDAGARGTGAMRALMDAVTGAVMSTTDRANVTTAIDAARAWLQSVNTPEIPQ